MNRKLIFSCILFLFFLFITGCLGESGIDIEKLDYEPDEYQTITDIQLKENPKIKECVVLLNSENYTETHVSIKCNQNEEEGICSLFKESNFFKYNGEYYLLRYYCAD